MLLDVEKSETHVFTTHAILFSIKNLIKVYNFPRAIFILNERQLI